MHFPPKFPTYSMVHLLHRLYGVDALGNMLTVTVNAIRTCIY